MATLATLVVDLIAETAKFMEGMDKAASKMTETREKIMGAGKKMFKTGGLITAGVTAPIAGMAYQAITAASDVEESANAVNVVFGESAGKILEWGDVAATQAGLARSEFYQLAAQSGAMLQNMGIDQAAAADESVSLAQRAADMASIFNTDVNQALEAIQAGLRGEIDPLERFGVKLNQSAIAAKAVEMGLADSTSQISDSAKAQASLALIYEQTDQLAGDFVNTSDGLANSMRIAKATAKDLAASFGAELLPYVQQGIGFLRDLLDRFMALNPEQRRTILLVAGIAAATGPVIVVLGALVTALGALISPIGLILVLVGLLAAAWFTNFGGIRDFLTELWTNTLQPIFMALVAWFQETLPIAIEFLSNLWTTVLLPALTIVWNFISKVLWPILTGIADVLNATVGLAVTALAGLWENILWPALQTVSDFLSATLGPAFEDIVEVIEGVLNPAITWLTDNIIQPLIEGFGGIIDAVKRVKDFLGELADKIRSIKLPDWLTPGSPTPFEMGLRGIANALNVISRAELPRLESRLGDLALAPIQASVAGAGVSPGGNETHFHFHNVRIDDERDLTRRIRTTQILMEA